MKRDFDAAATTWDLNDARVRMSLAIADAMIASLRPTGTEVLLDYGTGTGAVALKFQTLVRQVVAADSSQAMLGVLEQKAQALKVENVQTRVLDLEQSDAAASNIVPDIVTCAMTMHHIADTARFAATLHAMLPVGGRIAIADLDTETGDFHTDNTGVEHFGFDRNRLSQIFAGAGFHSIGFQTAYELTRPNAAGITKSYSIFLLSAAKG